VNRSVNSDLAANKISAIGVVCGIAGLFSFYAGVLAIVLGLVARRLGEKVWWWAVVAGVIGFFGRPLLTSTFGPFGT